MIRMDKMVVAAGAMALFVGLAVAGGPKFLKGKWFSQPELYPAAQTVTSLATISANACGGVKRIQATGDFWANTTNPFTAPSSASGNSNAGCAMNVINVSSHTITVSTSSVVVLNSSTAIVMGQYDTIRVASDGAQWYQIGTTGDN